MLGEAETARSVSETCPSLRGANRLGVLLVSSHGCVWYSSAYSNSLRMRTVSTLVVALVAQSWRVAVPLALFVSVLEAQPHCRKGIPCGNSCISASKTCRIGSPSQRPPSPPAPSVPERAAPAALLERPSGSTTIVDTLLPWVVSVTGATYFASACSGAAGIPANSRMFYRVEENLKRLGMSRATPKQEACSRTQMQEHERRVAASAQ